MDEMEITLAALHASPEDITATAPPEAAANIADPELDRALIKYITHSYRILFAEYVDTWQEFHSAKEANAVKYADHTAAALCQRFAQVILPQVYTYELTDTEKCLVELLQLHPEYERVAQGYCRVPAERRVGYSRQPKAGKDFQVVTQSKSETDMFTVPPTDATLTDSEEFQLDKYTQSPPHTFVMTVPYESQRYGYDFKFSKENAALLSAALSNDFELSNCMLLEPKELHQRLRTAKRNFEQHAKIPQNCDNAEALLAKIEQLNKLRKAIIDVVSSRF